MWLLEQLFNQEDHQEVNLYNLSRTMAVVNNQTTNRADCNKHTDFTRTHQAVGEGRGEEMNPKQEIADVSGALLCFQERPLSGAGRTAGGCSSLTSVAATVQGPSAPPLLALRRRPQRYRTQPPPPPTNQQPPSVTGVHIISSSEPEGSVRLGFLAAGFHIQGTELEL